MNRELRRLQAKEEERAKERRAAGVRPRRQRVGFRQFVSEIRTELKRVAWPSRQETATFTTVTLITAGFVTLYAFVLDLTMKQAVLKLLELR